MRVIFVPREGVDLYSALLSSETSREALRFYQPERTLRGVEIVVASMGSALALTSDLRWYVRRYMHDVIFEIAPGTFCTAEIARAIYYEREPVVFEDWKFKRVYTFQEGMLVSDEIAKPKTGNDEEVSGEGEGKTAIEVLCTERQYFGKKGSDWEDSSVTSS